MIALLRLHSYYLLSKKTQIISLGFALFIICLLSLLTRFYDDSIMRTLYLKTYLLEYSIEGFTVLKMALYMLGLYTVIELCLLTPYDTVLVQRVPRYMYYFSKYLVIWFYTVIMMIVFIVYYVIFSYLIYSSLHPLLTVKALGYFLILITLYTVFLYTISLLTKHMFALIIASFSFFMSDMFVGFNYQVSNVSLFAYILNVIAPNLHILTETTVSYLFPLRILVYLLILYGMTILIAIHKNEY